MRRPSFRWLVMASLSASVVALAPPVSARQFEGGGEICQSQLFLPGSDVAVCVDDWVLEMRGLWSTLFGPGYVFSINTPMFTLSAPMGGWFLGQGSNHLGQTFTVAIYDEAPFDWLNAFAAGQISADELALALERNANAGLVRAALSTSLGTVYVLGIAMSYFGPEGQQVSALAVADVYSTTGWGEWMEYSAVAQAGPCTCAVCDCSQFQGNMAPLSQARQDAYCQAACAQMNSAQQQRDQALSDLRWCEILNTATGALGIVAVGIAAGPGAPVAIAIGSAPIIAATALALDGCAQAYNNSIASINQNLATNLNNGCFQQCLLQAIYGP